MRLNPQIVFENLIIEFDSFVRDSCKGAITPTNYREMAQIFFWSAIKTLEVTNQMYILEGWSQQEINSIMSPNWIPDNRFKTRPTGGK